MSNLKSCSVGLIMYADSNQGMLPSDIEVLDDTEDECPASYRDYVYVGRGLNLNNLMFADRVPVAFDHPAHSHDGMINILFADGHAETIEIPEGSTCVDVVNKYRDAFSTAKEAGVILVNAAAADCDECME